MRTMKVAGQRAALTALGLVKAAFSGKDRLPGGPADKLPRAAFDQKQLRVGEHHELEHINSKAVASEIASDHLAEDPKYYQKLRKIEKL